jgi:fibronectin type 3 domain-containing protein
MRAFCLILALAAAFLTGCGYPGPVLPPLLEIPSQIPYVNAVEYGDQILVQFTQPDLTTEGNPILDLRLLEVRVGPPVTPLLPQLWEKTAKSYPVPNPAPGAFTREIPVADWVNQEVLISVRAIGRRGKAASWATLIHMKVEPPMAQPTTVAAENVAQGVKLTWKSAGMKYRVFRAIGDATPERLAEADRTEFVDETTQYDKPYQYLVQAIADDTHGSKVSEPIFCTPEDKFPPAVPGALTAILGVNTVELAWTRNTESDFKGYNVYRSTDGGPFVKIADLVPAPTFSDSQIEAGKKYRYEVSAVDVKGNESPHSTPADAAAQ